MKRCSRFQPGPVRDPRARAVRAAFHTASIDLSDQAVKRQKKPPPRQQRGRAVRFLFTYSHSPLWASHHAGNAGSFGESVGL